MNFRENFSAVDKSWRTLVTDPRFRPYLVATQGHESTAESLYLWNMEVSSAFFETLGFLEVAVRNSFDAELQNGQDSSKVDWLASQSPALGDKACQLIVQAKVHASRSRHVAPTRDNVISELNFGFWTAFTAKRFEISLWTPYLRHAFPHLKPQRRILVSTRLEKARALRNRIAHHESIFNRDLESEFEGIIAVLSWMSQDAAKWALRNSRVPLLLAHSPIAK